MVNKAASGCEQRVVLHCSSSSKGISSRVSHRFKLTSVLLTRGFLLSFALAELVLRRLTMGTCGLMDDGNFSGACLCKIVIQVPVTVNISSRPR